MSHVLKNIKRRNHHKYQNKLQFFVCLFVLPVNSARISNQVREASTHFGCSSESVILVHSLLTGVCTLPSRIKTQEKLLQIQTVLEAPKVTVWPTILAWSYVKSRQLSTILTAVDLKEHNLIQLGLAFISSEFIWAENCPFESTIFRWSAFYWVQSVIFSVSSLHTLHEGRYQNKN